MRGFGIGINTCFAVKRWPEPEAWAELVREDFGLDYVQFSLDLVDLSLETPALEAKAGQIRQACNNQNLVLHSCFTGLGAYNRNLLLAPDQDERTAALEWYRRAIRFAAGSGCRSMGGHLGALTVKEYDQPAVRELRIGQLVEAVARLSEEAKLAGLDHLLLEPMPVARELTSTMNDTANLLARLNTVASVPVKLCLDVGHACAHENSGPDRDPYTWLERFGALSPVVHIQQTDGQGDRHWPFTAKHNRNGIITPDRVTAALRKSGAKDVMLVLEAIHAPECPEQAVKDELAESIAYWKQAIGAR